jgi:hypothetical protein
MTDYMGYTPMGKYDKKTICLTLTVEEFIILRGSLNKFQIDRHRMAERQGKSSVDGAELINESQIAGTLFDMVDAEWAKG